MKIAYHMHKGFIRAGALFALLAVALGAFGAHSLKGKISTYALDIFQTGVTYQFYHALALCITGILFEKFPVNTLRWAGRFFIIGIILFSFSLYTLAAFKAAVQPGGNWIGAITPLGGLSFIAGWLCIMLACKKSASNANSR